jgi:hypothetical protein
MLESDTGAWVEADEAEAELAKRDELLRRAYQMIHRRQISLMLDGWDAENETNWLDDYHRLTESTTNVTDCSRSRQEKT